MNRGVGHAVFALVTAAVPGATCDAGVGIVVVSIVALVQRARRWLIGMVVEQGKATSAVPACVPRRSFAQIAVTIA
jgi:hypothetical protein